MANRLQYEKSPYLLQHQNNPVDWYPWGKEAFEKARAEDKPVFLSIGYSTCHWCHVMAHESFEDEEAAAVLNRNFICIKVDREERPDIDTIYMSVCQAMTGSGGWPLTVFMSPDQKPFYAGTYYPKRSSYGRPGLIELLKEISRLWTEQREELYEAGDQITHLIRQGQNTGSGNPDKSLLEKAFRQLAMSFDSRWGGFGDAPKFPTPHTLLFLMQYAGREDKKEALQMAEVTLDAMARGGIFDQIGGGFSRYSTDEQWLAPHFEKMLYDNALLIIAYLKAYQRTGKEFYADVVRRTVDYILRELTDEVGGFYCGQDADSEGVEGKYYLLTPEAVISVLGKEAAEEFCRLYDITEGGNFEGSNIPNRIGKTEPGWQKDDLRLKKLYDYRKARTSLHLDDKILLSWNAWTIIALAQAGNILKEQRYLEAAQKAQVFIEKHMIDERDRLLLRYRDGEALHTGQLDDYAGYSLALLELYRITFDIRYLQQAIHRAGQLTDLFADREHGGYFINAADAEQLITRPKETYDGAIPSGNSVAAMVFEELAGLTGETLWRKTADRQHRFMAGAAGAYPTASCFALQAMIKPLYPYRELICAGEGVPQELSDFLRTHPADDLAVLVKTKENQEQLAACAPFTASYPVSEHAAVWYLCENGTCQKPVADFTQLNLPDV